MNRNLVFFSSNTNKSIWLGTFLLQGWPITSRNCANIRTTAWSGWYGDSHVNSSSPKKMAAISQTTFPSTFAWMDMIEFRWKFPWNLFLGVQLTISRHWFGYGLAPNRRHAITCTNADPFHWRVYAALGGCKLKVRRPRDHFIFNMGILILVSRYIYIETGPWSPMKVKSFSNPWRQSDICSQRVPVPLHGQHLHLQSFKTQHICNYARYWLRVSGVKSLNHVPGYLMADVHWCPV